MEGQGGFVKTGHFSREKMMDIKKGYYPQFDIDLRYGQECEKLVAKMLTGFHEVKSDRMALTTGNLFIEFECRGKPSGLSTSKADWWTFHLSDDLYFVIGSVELRRMCLRKGIRKVAGGDGRASRGYLLPTENVLKSEKTRKENG